MSENVKETRIGIASFVLGLIMVAGWLTMLIVVPIAGSALKNSTLGTAIGLLVPVGLVTNIIGMVFGIIAFLKKNVKKTLAVIGLSVNSGGVGLIFFVLLLEYLVGR